MVILIVDDMEELRSLYWQIVSKVSPGNEVKTAGSAEEAKEILRSCNVDLLLTDYNLGGGETGIELAKFAGGLLFPPRTILMSSAMPEDLSGASGAISATIDKPFTPKSLAQLLERLGVSLS